MTPRTITRQISLSVGFPRQEYWSGFPPSPGDIPDPGIEPRFPTLKADFFTIWATRPYKVICQVPPWWSSGKKKKKKSAFQFRGWELDPWSWNIPCAMEQLSPYTVTSEACVPRACAPQQEKPLQWEAHAPRLESSPCWPQVEKAQAKQQRPRADKMQEVVKSWEPQGKGWLYRKWWKFGSIKADYHYEQDHTLIQHVHNSTKSWRKQCFWNLDRFGFTSWLCSWFAQFC